MDSVDRLQRVEETWVAIEQQRRTYKDACKLDESHRLDNREALLAWCDYGRALSQLRLGLGSDAALQVELRRLADRLKAGSSHYSGPDGNIAIAMWIASNWEWISPMLQDSPFWPREPAELRRALERELRLERWSPDIDQARRATAILRDVFGMSQDDPATPPLLVEASRRVSEQLPVVLLGGTVILRVITFEPLRRGPAELLMQLEAKDGYIKFQRPRVYRGDRDRYTLEPLDSRYDHRDKYGDRWIAIEGLQVGALRHGVLAELHLGLESTWVGVGLISASIHIISPETGEQAVIWEAEPADCPNEGLLGAIARRPDVPRDG